MPLDTKHLFLTSPELGNQFILILILILILTGRRAAGPTAAFLPVRGPSNTSPRRHAMCHGWPRSLSRVDLFKSEVSIISRFQETPRY
jgi:hypothetical protein